MTRCADCKWGVLKYVKNGRFAVGCQCPESLYNKGHGCFQSKNKVKEVENGNDD